MLSAKDLYSTEEQVIAGLKSDATTAHDWEAYTRIRRVRRTPRPVEDAFCVRVNAKRRYLDPFAAGAGRVTAYSEPYREAVGTFLSVSFEEWLSEA